MNKQLLVNCFQDQHEENSFKRCIDVHEISGRLQQQGLALDQQIGDQLHSVLTCFGDIEWEEGYADRVPPETDE